MSISPEEAQQAARDQLGGVAASVSGQDVAGIYGDPAGASQHAAPQSQEDIASQLAAKGGAGAAVDTDALLAQVQALAAQLASLQQQADARQAAMEITAPTPPSLVEILASSAIGAQVVHAFKVVEERLAALEAKS